MVASIPDQIASALARGWAVLPLFGILADSAGNLRCQCPRGDCTSPGKHPILSDGVTGASADPVIVKYWHNKYPAANWGIATGGQSRLLVIDCDCREGIDGDSNLAALGQLPPAPNCATGGGGEHYYLRLPDDCPEVGNSASKIGPGIDIRSAGGYVVAPGSLHISGAKYRWRELDDIDPPLAPDWLIKLLLSGKKKEQTAAHSKKGKVLTGRHQWILETSARLVSWGMHDEAIFAALKIEIPQKLDLSDGRIITDEEIYNAISGARRKGFDDIDQGALVVAGSAIAEEILSHEKKDQPDPPINLPESNELAYLLDCTQGGLRQLAEFGLADAHRPQPEIALGAALATWSAILGHSVQLPDATRTNIFLVAVANSGAGKDAPRNACKRALIAAELQPYLGADAWSSHAGIHGQLNEHAQRISFLDEYGKLLEACSNERAPAHLREILNVLLKVYSSSADYYLGGAYADTSKNISIKEPHLSIFGTTTHATLFGAMTRQALGDGLMARTLVFPAVNDLPNKRHNVTRMPPEMSMLESMKMWASYGRGDIGHRVETIPLSKDAAQILEKYSDQCDAIIRKDPGAPTRSIWTRCHASAKKIALIYYCACRLPPPFNSAQLIVDATAARWAIQFVEHCAQYAVRECSRSIGETRHEKMLIDLEQTIASNPGISIGGLAKTWRRVPAKQRTELIHELIEQGRIASGTEAGPKGRPATVFRVVG